MCESKDTDTSLSTWSALAELTPLECEDRFAEGLRGEVPNPTPHQSRSARMGGWHTATTSHGGPQDSTQRPRVKDEG